MIFKIIGVVCKADSYWHLITAY